LDIAKSSLSIRTNIRTGGQILLGRIERQPGLNGITKNTIKPAQKLHRFESPVKLLPLCSLLSGISEAV
jgi:hypothetical protein